MGYHQQMMNVLHSQSGNDTYKQGHKDARHQCAEIALEADARIAALEAELDRLREALEHSVQMHEARAEWIRETALKWNGLSVITGRSARAHLLARAADDENATAELCRQALQPKEQSSADAQEARE